MILLAVVFLTAAQLIIKSRLNEHGPIPLTGVDLPRYLLTIIQDLRLVVGFALLAVAAFGWYAGMSRVPLSLAFPVAALTYPLVLAGAVVFLREDFSWLKLVGNILIVGGIVMVMSSQ